MKININVSLVEAMDILKEHFSRSMSVHGNNIQITVEAPLITIVKQESEAERINRNNRRNLILEIRLLMDKGESLKATKLFSSTTHTLLKQAKYFVERPSLWDDYINHKIITKMP